MVKCNPLPLFLSFWKKKKQICLVEEETDKASYFFYEQFCPRIFIMGNVVRTIWKSRSPIRTNQPTLTIDTWRWMRSSCVRLCMSLHISS